MYFSQNHATQHRKDKIFKTMQDMIVGEQEAKK